jgi:DNA-binding response OmpR family regulator
MPPQTDAKRVLIVDDDQNMRALIRRMLGSMRFDEIIEADSAQQALNHVENASAAFNLVICDWTMPGMSGFELFTKVHALRPDLPFLMLTGRTDADSVIAAKKAGLTAYLAKPVSPAQLQAKVRLLAGGNC